MAPGIEQQILAPGLKHSTQEAPPVSLWNPDGEGAGRAGAPSRVGQGAGRRASTPVLFYSALAACRTRDSRFTHLIDIIALKISVRKDPVLTTKGLRRKSDRLLEAEINDLALANDPDNLVKQFNLIYEGGCQEKQLPDGLRPPHRVLVEAASPLFRYARKFRRFKNRPCNTVTEFGN